MIVLYIIGGILLLIFLLLCIPVHLIFEYSGQTSLSVRYLFIRTPIGEKKGERPAGKFRLFLRKILNAFRRIRSWIAKQFDRLLGDRVKNRKRKAKTQRKKEVAGEEKKSAISQLIGQRGVSGVAELFTSIASLSVGRLRRIFRGAVIDELTLDMTICGEDAAQTAISYGRWSAVLFPAVSIFLSAVKKCKFHFVRLQPDFSSEEQRIIMHIRLHFFPLLVLHHALLLLLSIIWSEAKKSIMTAMKEAREQSSSLSDSADKTI